MTESPAHLVVLAPSAAPRVVALSAEVTTVGAGASCVVRVTDPDVEEVHLEVRRTESAFEVVRVGASLSVNGKRVRHHVLEASDVILVGRTCLSFRWGRPPGQATPAEPRIQHGGAPALERLLAFSRRLQETDAPEALREQLVVDLRELTGADSVSCAWLDRAGAVEAVIRSSSGSSDVDSPERSAISRTMIARALDERRAVLWLDAGQADPGGALDLTTSLRSAGVASVMAAPVLREDAAIAVLYASSARAGAFGQETLDLIALYAGLGARLIDEDTTRRELARREAAGRSALEIVRTGTLVGSSATMRALVADIGKAARADLPVLVLGETGTGKELVARLVHERSRRKDGPFIAVNCGAVPEQLLESTLFGHVKGAFTGAHGDQAGLLRAAHGGTLFLDEVAELTAPHQAKLLRALERREVLPVGASQPQAVDFRLVSATLRPLDPSPKPASDAAAGRLREDLYYRIAGVVLRVPPLRERAEDALELAEYFLRRQRQLLERPGLRLSASARHLVATHGWPGNVRELETAIARAAAMSEDDALEADALGLAGPRAAIKPLGQIRDELLKAYVLEVVDRFGGNRTAAAEALGVTPRTIFKYLEEV